MRRPCLILRDDGILFDITDSDLSIHSFTQYIVTREMSIYDRRLHLATTGCNQNEFYLSD